jgi:uncharacterized lipoprotein YmbA
MMRVALIMVALLLSACGSKTALTPKAGQSLPIKPQTASAVPTPEQLLTPDSQARPKRSDEQLRRSQERRDDKFDLPPPG